MEPIKSIAEKFKVDEAVVAKVISSAFEELNKATKVHNSLEISGFGTLKLSANKILKKLPNFKYMVDYFEKRYVDNPNPDDFKKMNDIRATFENLKYRYEQIKGEPPVILERSKTLRQSI